MKNNENKKVIRREKAPTDRQTLKTKRTQPFPEITENPP